MIWNETVSRSNEIARERRDDRRYDIRLDLRWKLVRRRRLIDAGVGHTLDLSRGGVRFYAGCVLSVGLNVELAVAWPARLHNVAPMILSIYGKILRSDQGWAAIRTLQHEFRTLEVQPEDRQAPRSVGSTPGLFLVSATGQSFSNLQ